MSASQWRKAMNAGAGRTAWPQTAAAPAPPRAAPWLARNAATQSHARWLRWIAARVRARHVLVLLAVLAYPAVAPPFFTFQIGGQALALGLIALSLTFLAGYGGMVSLAQMTVAGLAGYLVAIFGSSSMPAISLGWPWWLAVGFAIGLATLFATAIGRASCRERV